MSMAVHMLHHRDLYILFTMSGLTFLLFKHMLIPILIKTI